MATIYLKEPYFKYALDHYKKYFNRREDNDYKQKLTFDSKAIAYIEDSVMFYKRATKSRYIKIVKENIDAYYNLSLIYKKIGNAIETSLIEADNDPVYGKGFKKMREIARKKGYYGLIQYVKTQKS